jgi:hypothetical protein
MFLHNSNYMNMHRKNSSLMKDITPNIARTKAQSKAFGRVTLTLTRQLSSNSQPPLPIRSLLVSTSTALCTPIFPAIGFINLCLRIIIPDPNLRYKFNASLGTICNIAFYYVLPFGIEFSPLLLPCAISNGIVAGGAYTVLDLTARYQSRLLTKYNVNILRNPIIAGGGIGATTGLIAPYFYGTISESLYHIEGLSDSLNSVLWGFPFFTQVSCMTGFAAGVMMYPILHYPIYGIEALKWQGFSGVLLLASGVTLYYMYRPDGIGRRRTDEDGTVLDGRTYVICPDGAFVERNKVPLLSTIVRYDAKEAKFGAYSIEEGQWMGDPQLKEKGQMIAESVRRYQKPGWWDGGGGGDRTRYTFDNQILAFYCEWWDRGLGEKHADRLVHVMGVKELQAYEDCMYRTDWVVKSIMEMNDIVSDGKLAYSNSHGQLQYQNQEDFLNRNDEKMRANIQQMKMYGNVISDREGKRRVESVQATSVAVQLLMVAMRNISGSDIATNANSIAITDIEEIARNRAPGILLYKTEEPKGLKGQSVESQLEELHWEGPSVDQALRDWQELQGEERGRKVRNGLLIASGILLSLCLKS